MKFLLDTDHVTIIQYPTGSSYLNIKAHAASHSAGDVAHSIVSFQEQVAGALASIHRARRPDDVVRGYGRPGKVLEYYSGATVLPFDAGAAAEYDVIRTGARGIGTMDLRIASIARSRGLTLLTRNRRDFDGIPGLVTADWTV